METPERQTHRSKRRIVRKDGEEVEESGRKYGGNHDQYREGYERTGKDQSEE